MEHKKNEWGIEVVGSSTKEESAKKNVKIEENESVDELMKQLEDLQHWTKIYIAYCCIKIKVSDALDVLDFLP